MTAFAGWLSARVRHLGGAAASAAGHVVVALVLACGLVSGGMAVLVVAADRTLEGASAPRIAAGPALTPLPEELPGPGSPGDGSPGVPSPRRRRADERRLGAGTVTVGVHRGAGAAAHTHQLGGGRPGPHG